MDAFYAAVEQRDRPELRGKPVIIGADPQGGRGRGVVSTCSYEARRFGVSSAMPISTAYRLCPRGVFIPPDMAKYAAVSKQVKEVFERFTDLVEPLSLDEAFLDVTGSIRLFGDGATIARRIKDDIVARTGGLTASAGVAGVKLVAKIASDLKKPDGLVVVPHGAEAAFLAPLPVRKLWGVGPRMEERLAKLGVHTIGQLAEMPLDGARTKAKSILGTHGLDLQKLARGEDERSVVPGGVAKSVSVETTYETDQSRIEVLRRTLVDLSDELARRLRKDGLSGRTITLKYRDETFRTTTHARTIKAPTSSFTTIFDVVWTLFRETHGDLRVRLLGVGVSGFDVPRQKSLLDDDESPASDASRPDAAADRRADSTVSRARDQLRERFGEAALVRASSLGPEGRAPRIQPSSRTRRRT
jgi:nucleotidyltransferase/DNA polymerase involved in DNA repair